MKAVIRVKALEINAVKPIAMNIDYLSYYFFSNKIILKKLRLIEIAIANRNKII